MEIDINFMAGFALGMLTCAGSISVLVVYAAVVVGARADKNLKVMEHKKMMSLFKVTHSWDEE